MPAVLALLFVEFPFCQSHKNSILDDKLNGHSAKYPQKSIDQSSFKVSLSEFMTKTKRKAGMNRTQAMQESQASSGTIR